MNEPDGGFYERIVWIVNVGKIVAGIVLGAVIGLAVARLF